MGNITLDKQTYNVIRSDVVHRHIRTCSRRGAGETTF